MSSDDHPSDEPDRAAWLRNRLDALHVIHQQETIRFVLVSALDLFMTYLLLFASRSGWTHMAIRESNPIADFFYGGWGIRGMIYFKFIMVAVIAVLGQVIATRRPATARALLNVATLAVGVVVIYSVFMFVRNMRGL